MHLLFWVLKIKQKQIICVIVGYEKKIADAVAVDSGNKTKTNNLLLISM